MGGTNFTHVAYSQVNDRCVQEGKVIMVGFKEREREREREREKKKGEREYSSRCQVT